MRELHLLALADVSAASKIPNFWNYCTVLRTRAAGWAGTTGVLIFQKYKSVCPIRAHYCVLKIGTSTFNTVNTLLSTPFKILNINTDRREGRVNPGEHAREVIEGNIAVSTRGLYESRIAA
jgi:hypothetical protein